MPSSAHQTVDPVGGRVGADGCADFDLGGQRLIDAFRGESERPLARFGCRLQLNRHFFDGWDRFEFAHGVRVGLLDLDRPGNQSIGLGPLH
jgi:hypothetical protein